MNNSIAKQRYISFNLFPTWKQPVSSKGTGCFKHGNNPFLTSGHMLAISLVFLMLLSGISKAWGQTDYSGTYYIGTAGYNASTPNSNFYLCPTEGWIYYKPTNEWSTDGTTYPNPFLTTYKCKTSGYHGGDATNAVWYVEKHPTQNFYYIKHASDGKYVISNGQIDGTSNANRMRVHLEEVTGDPDDKALFSIYPYPNSNPEYLVISPISSDGWNGDYKWYTVNGGNKNYLVGNGSNGGPTDYTATGGIIGLYTENDNNAKFYLEKAISIDPPTITNNDDGTFTITAATGATIYYTTNGDTPTTSTTTTGTTPVIVNQTESMTVIKAIAKATSDNFPTPVVTYILPVCEKPTIKVSGGTVTITCATAGAEIHYTTDGTPATSSSATYEGPFAKGSATEIRAIATKAGYVISSETVYLPPTEVSSSSEITDMTGNYTLADGFSSTASIGSSTNPFKGTIDGGLNPLTLSYPLVAFADGAIIKNVILDNNNVTISDNENGNAGAICCEATGDTRIYNCGVLGGSVGGSNNVGGIVGLLDGRARVINCYNYANITSGSNCGGIVGYNNVASTSSNLQTMVMNCMFYGNITGGNAAPIYGGNNIHNKYVSADDTGLNNYCYFLYDEEKNPYVKTISTDKYHGALGAEERYLNRFEFFRMTLNSTRNLAAFYVTGDATQKGEIAKWVLDKSIAPYPILKVQDTYPSVVNPDAAHATSQTERNKGGLLGTLSVTISGPGSGAVFSAPTGASITTGSKTLNITDKDYDNFNYNYKKVQLPYYNEVGIGNYTKASPTDGTGRVVTGWKITSITGGTSGEFTTGVDAPAYNFVDRKCTNKDLYSESGRVFAQGAYWEVPDGVTAITIEPYWAKAVYLSDVNYDMTYTITMSGSTATANKYGVSICGSCPTSHNEQTVYTDLSTAITNLGSDADHTVYDYAVVLVGNYHQAADNALVNNGNKPVTFMSADLDGDNEPDNTLFYYHNQRKVVSPIRFDFLNIPGIGMVKRTYDSSMDPEPGILAPKGWFEITNTVFIRFGQFEYAGSNSATKTILAPLILQGGIYEQFVSSCRTNAQNTNYLLIGGNAWFKNFANGCHTAQANTTPKVPINVTGGDYTNFYLTGIYQPAAAEASENAECYIDGGRFTEVAGTGMQQLKGNVTWLINAADITSFFGGGINAAKPITGSISTTISNSYVDEFYGGPKFGDMTAGMTVTTNATDCHFGKYFGAGYGGTAFNRVGYVDDSKPHDTKDWDGYVDSYYKRASGNGGISTNYEYEFILHSDGNQTVARFFVNYASLSLASTRDVTNTLSGCTIGTFYGGGSLGAVNGDINSALTNCKVTGNVFGAGFSASVPTVEVWNAGAYLDPKPTYNRTANVFNNASVKTPKDNGEYVVYTWSKTQGSNANPFVVTEDGKHYIHTDVSLDGLGAVTGNVTLNILGENTLIQGDVYGGGAESRSNTDYYKETSPNLATKTTVNLIGGNIMGDVYGGGLGRLAKDAVGTPGSEGYQAAVEEVEANVGNTVVNLNGTKTVTMEDGKEVTSYNDKCVVNGSIFGCNNINGTPKGNATVHIYKTWGTSRTSDDNLDNIDDSKHKYHLQAVYGGGNLAAYDPDEPGTKKAYVIIDGCDLTSIKTVYGGGNAASTPATQVDVNGTYEIEEVFGGGNGKDQVNGRENPGANVGYYNYTVYDADNHAGNADNAQTPADRREHYQYGTGKANVNIYGGLVHRVYGGSNTKGNVRQVAVTMLDNNTDCEFKVDEAYGGGKSAPMDGAANLVMQCIPGLKAAYGGAENANINDNVTLNITNGNFDRVFGGNNVSGTISGTITVNIEETGCKPIFIKQLYGGGNQAAYTGPWKDADDHSKGRQGPTLNVRSFTSIGDVYGGGYGLTAVVEGDTHVNINESHGRYYTNATSADSTGTKEFSFTQYKRVEPTADNPEGYVYTDEEKTERATEAVTMSVELPPHAAGEMGAIHNVFGGGNAAKVIGNTYVNIGTQSTDTFVTPTSDSEEARTKAVLGANITGNVYGGGNNAEVTGNANVQIGKRTDVPSPAPAATTDSATAQE